MSRKDNPSSNKAIWIICLFALVLATAISIAVWSYKKTEPSHATGLQEPDKVIAQKGPVKVRHPIPEAEPEMAGSSARSDKPDKPDVQKQPVVDYDRLGEDETLQALMKKRKEKYGFEEGVDLIVKPDESIKVGDEILPVNEILERIRLKEGEVLEKDIGGSTKEGTAGAKINEVVAELDIIEKRYQQLDQMVKDTEPTQDKEKTETYVKEREELGKVLTVYEDYKDTVKKIEEKRKLLASLSEQATPEAPQETTQTSAQTSVPGAPKLTPEASVVTPKPAEKSVSMIPMPSKTAAPLKPEPVEPPESAAPRLDAKAAPRQPESAEKSIQPATVPAESSESAAPRLEARTEPQQPESPGRREQIVSEQTLEETKSEKPIPAVGAGTVQHPGAPFSSKKPEASPDQSRALPIPPEKETPEALNVTPHGDIREKEIAMQQIRTTLPTPSHATPNFAAPPQRSAPPKPSLEKEKTMATIESLKKEIQREINMLLLEKSDLENELLLLLKKDKRPEAYGIYVVQNNDNIWNIHYKFLKEYFGRRRVDLTWNSDEPDSRGRSSGIGKILKFSEKMVYIYNINERELASDLNLIHPRSKIVVFNMARVFDLLKDIDYQELSQILFDGENIWLPAKG